MESVVDSAQLGGSCKSCTEAGLKGAKTAKQDPHATGELIKLLNILKLHYVRGVTLAICNCLLDYLVHRWAGAWRSCQACRSYNCQDIIVNVRSVCPLMESFHGCTVCAPLRDPFRYNTR